MAVVLIRLKNAPKFSEGMWLVGELLTEGDFGIKLKDACTIFEVLQKAKSGGDVNVVSTCMAQDLYTSSPYTIVAGEFDGLRELVEGETLHKNWLTALDAFRLQKVGLHAPNGIQKNLNGIQAEGLT